MDVLSHRSDWKRQIGRQGSRLAQYGDTDAVTHCGGVWVPAFPGSNPGAKRPNKTACPGTSGDDIPPCTVVSGIEPSTQRLSVSANEHGAQGSGD